jgi:hypothetical protein
LEVLCPVLVKTAATTLAATLGLLALFFAATVTVIGALIGDIPAPRAAGECVPHVLSWHGPVAGFRAEQVANAATIVAVGSQLGVPAQGWLVALTAALTESGLRNLGYGDRDSLGLFQQRPSQGWGTPTQIQNPRYSATQFYRHLLALPHWRQMSINNAAQAVQRSATPTAYAPHEPAARALLDTITHTNTNANSPTSNHRSNTPANPYDTRYTDSPTTATALACSPRGTPPNGP